MNINELKNVLDEETDFYKRALILCENGLDLFIENPNEIIPYLDELGVYADKQNSYYLAKIFSTIETDDHKVLNRIMDICVSVFYHLSNITGVLENFTKNSGSFVYILNEDFENAADALFSQEKNKKYFFEKVISFDKKHKYYLIVKK